jgi:heme/copper-type cytochrome/quinol oxidase subunit 3
MPPRQPHAQAFSSDLSNYENYRRKLENVGLFWHFIDLLWIFIFPLLYLTRGV